MSVLIKGRRMPTSCYDCPFEESVNFCYGEKETCPLIEIPPHGRLIDADALTQQIMMKADATCGWADALDLALAPTIIEAEGGE